MPEHLSEAELDELMRLCVAANCPDRGEIVRYCLAHDYGDPGFPPEDCPDCEFERDEARRRLATVAGVVLPALIAEIRALRRGRAG